MIEPVGSEAGTSEERWHRVERRVAALPDLESRDVILRLLVLNHDRSAGSGEQRFQGCAALAHLDGNGLSVLILDTCLELKLNRPVALLDLAGCQDIIADSVIFIDRPAILQIFK